MIRELVMTVLIDNLAEAPLVGEWGLSIAINADDSKLLLDTGSSELFSINAARMGIRLDDVDTGVLSHAHYDHSDGLDTFFAINQTARFLIREQAKENCYGIKDGKPHYIGIRKGTLRAHAGRIHYVSGVYKIKDGIWLVPHRNGDYSRIAYRSDLYLRRGNECRPDDFAHEQSLVIETDRGLVVFNSCSHTGISNIVLDIEAMLGRRDIFAYVGGLHLYRLSDEELFDLCDEIKDTGIEHIFTGHCTGDHAFEVLKSRLGDRIYQFRSGYSYRFV